MKLELVLKKELLQSGCELAPEDATQGGDGQEESSRGGDPSGTVGCKTASRNNVVYVRMMVKVLSPSVEHANGGTYKVPKFLGNAVIHPYSDFLLHDVGTGDGIPQAAKPEYLDQSTANKFRTPPLWGLRFRHDLMHDGDSPGGEAAIARHGGEATTVRQRYEHSAPTEKHQLNLFLKSL